jgi:hypothetical protein
MITFDEKIVGIWFLGTVNGHQDWLAALRELEPDRRYELTYRFRYHDDDKVFDSKDRKNWYRGEIANTRAFAIAGIREAVRQLASASDGKPCELMMNEERDVEKFFLEFEKLPFVFARMEKKVPE